MIMYLVTLCCDANIFDHVNNRGNSTYLFSQSHHTHFPYTHTHTPECIILLTINDISAF